MSRPSWDETNMEMVAILAKRSTCKYYQVGCRFIEPVRNLLIAEGYNGPAKNRPHCTEVGCNKDLGGYCVGNHAEANAIFHCHGSPVLLFPGTTCYITTFPCNQCMKQLASAPIARVVFLDWYQRRVVLDGITQFVNESEGSTEIAVFAGIRIDQYDPVKKCATPIT